ncbi:MAG: Flp family type IVb pilin [Thermodesulfovibrionales bacterium]|jgi:Flp pilus assembly pilin Flp
MAMKWWTEGVDERLIQEKGASSIEYAIIAGAIALVVIVAVGLLGETLRDILQRVVDDFPK